MMGTKLFLMQPNNYLVKKQCNSFSTQFFFFLIEKSNNRHIVNAIRVTFFKVFRIYEKILVIKLARGFSQEKFQSCGICHCYHHRSIESCINSACLLQTKLKLHNIMWFILLFSESL